MPLQFDLHGRTALITGGASGIGLATVRLLATSGAKVAVNHLPDDVQAASTVESLIGEGLDVFAVPGDVGAPYDTVQQFMREGIERLGHLDYLVNNAASFGMAPIPHDRLDEITDEFWLSTLNVNVIGPFRCVRAARDRLKEARGAVVNLASVAGLTRPGSTIPYAASKAALVKMTIDLARALAPLVRVNAVAPSLTRSPWTDTWTDERKAQALKRTPLGAILEPDEIALAIVFLLAGGMSITGQTLVVDGGASIS